jgi:PHD/YefM family antitoxin component YafN of YafNO toxin-antitoxin module
VRKQKGEAMTTTTLTSREFSQDAGKAKQAAERGPVIITDQGHPMHVLLTFSDYRKLTTAHARIADLLAMPGSEDIELPLQSNKDVARAADLS